MRHEHSYGIVPLRQLDSQWMVYLVKLWAGHWGFPKGHPEKGEDPIQAATRELEEETRLKVKKLLTTESYSEHYIFTSRGEKISKRVSYFPALVEGTAELQQDEVADGKWVLLNEAHDHVTFSEAKAILEEVKRLVFKRPGN